MDIFGSNQQLQHFLSHCHLDDSMVSFLLGRGSNKKTAEFQQNSVFLLKFSKDKRTEDKILMKNTIRKLLMLIVMQVTFGVIAAPTVSLAWDPSPDADVTNYRLYWGPGSGNYNGSSDLGNVTNTVFTQLVSGGHYYFVVTALNAGGAESDPSNEIDFLVPGGNTPPAISSIANQRVTIGTAIPQLVFLVGDVETAVASLTVVVGSSNPTLIPVSNISFGGSGATRTITIVSVSGRFGTSTITLTVSDGSGGTASSTFTVTVDPLLDNSYIVSSGFSLDKNFGIISGNVFSLPTDAKSVYWAKGNLTVTQGQVLTLRGNVYYGSGLAPISVFLVNDSTGYWLSPERVIYADGTYGVRQTELVVFDNCTNSKLYVVSGHRTGSYQFQRTAITLTNPAVPPVPNLYLKQLLAKQSAGINSAEWEWQPAVGSQGYVVRTATNRVEIEKGSAGSLLGQWVLPASQITYRLDITTPLYGGVYVAVTSVKNGVESTPWITWYLLGDIFKTVDEAIPPLCFQGSVDAQDKNFAQAGYTACWRIPALVPGMPAGPLVRCNVDQVIYNGFQSAGRPADNTLISARASLKSQMR